MNKKYFIIIFISLILFNSYISIAYDEEVLDYFHIVYIEPRNEDKIEIPRKISGDIFIEYNRITFKDPKHIIYLGKVVYYSNQQMSFVPVEGSDSNHTFEVESYLSEVLLKEVGSQTNNYSSIKISDNIWKKVRSKLDDPRSWFAIIDNNTGNEFFSNNRSEGIVELAKGVNIYGDSPEMTALVMYDDGKKKYEIPYYSETAVYLSGYGYIGSKNNHINKKNITDNDLMQKLLDSIK